MHALGAGHRRVVLRHIIPKILAPYLIMGTAQLGRAILAEASRSYLDLGTAEPTPSWGLTRSGSASSYAEKAPFFGDSLRDALDPKLRRG